MRICLLCDHPFLSRIIQDFLLNSGREVICASTFFELLDCLRADDHPADLVLADMNIRDSDVMTQIAALHREYPGIAILMAVGNGSRPTPDEAAANGVYAYLRKPISLFELELLLTRVAERRAIGK